MNRIPAAVLSRRGSVYASSVFLVVLVLATAGCPGVPTSDGGGGDGTDGGSSGGGVTATIVNISSNIRLSQLDPAVSVTYSVTGTPTTIAGFFAPATEPASRTIVASNLPATGNNMRFSFDPRASGAGFFRVGLLLTVAGQDTAVLSDGTIQVEGPPEPFFIQPLDATTTVAPGDEVFISFDAGDPDSLPEQIHWRLGLLAETDSRAVSPDTLGAQIAVGTGNTGSATLQTTTVSPGGYTLAFSATDSGASISATVASGRSDRIVTAFGPNVRIVNPSDVSPPTLTFSKPGSADVALFRNQLYTLEFATTIVEVGATVTVELFYDDDRDVTNGFRETIEGAEALPATRTTFPLPTDLPEGTWTIGATLRTVGGISQAVTFYAAGRVTIVRDPTLTVTQPDSALPVAPGANVSIAWTTNAPAGSGTVDVAAIRLGSSVGANTEIPILTGQAMTTRTATFTNDTPGQYQILVRLEFNDGTEKESIAPRIVRVTSLPPVLWVGSLGLSKPPFDGAIFGGVNFEDNAGTTMSTAGDLDGDGRSEFVIGARYGKPFFVNPSGVGPGEAYLVFGGSGVNQPKGVLSLNSVSTKSLRGVVLPGIRTRQDVNDTDGMSSVSSVPDVDGDLKPELVFGFPRTRSRGHNISTQQDGVVDPRGLATLEREEQFLRGGIVLVSSSNSVFSTPSGTGLSVPLDVVGQDFESTCVEPEPDGTPVDGPPVADEDRVEFSLDVRNDVAADGSGCTGTCLLPSSGGKPDASGIDYGFVPALSRDFFSVYVYGWHFFGGIRFCDSVDVFLDHECLERKTPSVPLEYCAPFVTGCEPFSPGLHADAFDLDPIFPSTATTDPHAPYHSGFYSTYIESQDVNGDTIVRRNQPVEPLGARIIGVGIGDAFGTSLARVASSGTGPGDVIVSAPARAARGILLGKFPPGCTDPPSCGGEINGLESSLGTAKVSSDAGVAYLFSLRSLWTDGGGIPPRPHQYIVGEGSHSCSAQGIQLIDNVAAVRIAGFAGDRISNIAGIEDFNGDGRDDFAMGAPNANGGQGRVYIAYRRQPSVEGDYVLEKLASDPSNPERLDGMLVVADGTDALGSSLVSGVDFNGDGKGDLVIGSPSASAGRGEIIVLFSGAGLVSPADGFRVSQLLTTTRSADGQPVAIRITGNALDGTGGLGFNVANGGDIDGDELDDLLVSAPGASPRFDKDPTDAADTFTEPGLDLDFDGVKDDLRTVSGLPTACVGADGELTNAGVVYVIYGRNRLDRIRTCSVSGKACSVDGDCPATETCGTTTGTISIDQLGTDQLRGMMIVGRCAGDRLGGGDAGDATAGGLAAKAGRGRSAGLATAGDVDGDGRADILIGSILADPRRDANTGVGIKNGGEAYLIYGSVAR